MHFRLISLLKNFVSSKKLFLHLNQITTTQVQQNLPPKPFFQVMTSFQVAKFSILNMIQREKALSSYYKC